MVGDRRRDRADAVTASRIGLQSVQDWRTATCKYCGRTIRWAVTKAGKNITLEQNANVQPEADGSLTVSTDDVHWATCPRAHAIRRASRSAPSERID